MEIADLIKQLTKNKEEIYSVVCKVVEIDEEKRVVKVSPANGSADIFDVRLQTSVSGLIGLVLFPKIDTDVIVNFVSKEMAYIALFSEIEKIELKIGDLSLFVDGSNTNLTSENIDIIAENTEISSDNVKINASDTQINSEAVKVVSTNFEVQGATIKLTAPIIDLIGTAVKVQGAFTVNGATAINGALVINGGGNGGIPLGGALSNEINKIKTDFQNLKAKFNAWTPVSNDGGSALKTQLSGWLPNTTPINAAAISNPQITQ